MDKTKKENRIKVNINKFYQFTIFKKLQEPEIKIKNKVRSNSLISAIKKRKKDIEKIIDNTKFQNNDELIKFEDNLKKNKYHLKKSRNIFPIMKDERNNFHLSQNEFSLQKKKINYFKSFSIGKKSNKSLNQTNISFKTCLSSTRERTYIINNYEDNSNVFVTNHREYSNEITTPFKTFEKNFHSNKSRNIRLCIGNNSLYKSTSPKKLIDFNSIDINKSNQNQSNQTLDGNNLMNITENFLKRRKSINKRLIEIEKKK
jgi:hypothetical protein